jgi:glyoxylate reductase
MRPKVFVVQAIPEPAMQVLCGVADVEVFPRLDRQISLTETIDAARRSDYLVALHGNYMPAEVIDANPDLKGIGIMGGTTAKVDMDAALRHKIPIVTAPPGGQRYGAGPGKTPNVGVATAELTLSLMLALAYRVLDSDRYTRANASFQEQTMALMSHGFYGLTVGLLGLGRVGKHLLQRLQGFETTNLYYKRTRLLPEDEQRLNLEWSDFDGLFARSDFLVVLVDYNDTTHEMVGAREFALMKETAYFVNPARGRIVDEVALIEALERKQIAGAGLEVFYHEPPLVWDPWIPDALKRMDNVILTPHNGGAVYPSRANQLKPIVDGIRDLIEGRRPPGLLNPEIYGEPTLYPELYGRGPVVPAKEGGPANFVALVES